MQFRAKSRYIKYSPFKLRPIADVVRGKNAAYAIAWLKNYQTQRAVPLKKAIESAVANARFKVDVDPTQLIIKDVRIDQGPSFRYYKPGAMGRASVLKRPYSHISVIVEQIEKDKEV